MEDAPMYVADPVFAAALALDRLSAAVMDATGTAKSILLDAMRSVAGILAAAVPEKKVELRTVSAPTVFRSL